MPLTNPRLQALTKHLDDTGLSPQEEPTASPDHGSNPPAGEAEQARLPTPPPPSQETTQHKAELKSDSVSEPSSEPLSEAHLHALFAGAPHFRVTKVNGRCTPTASFPWSTEAATKDATDIAPLAEPAFSAATLHKHSLKAEPLSESPREYNGYAVDVVETPCMLGIQGIEPGTIGFSYFLELPKSDVLLSEHRASQSSSDAAETSRNKDMLYTNPERLGIRLMDLGLIYDRLGEFQDMSTLR